MQLRFRRLGDAGQPDSRPSPTSHHGLQTEHHALVPHELDVIVLVQPLHRPGVKHVDVKWLPLPGDVNGVASGDDQRMQIGDHVRDETILVPGGRVSSF